MTNANGYGVIDLASIYAAKALKPGTSHTFTVRVSGNANITDIEGITMTQRILTSLEEFGAQAVYGADVSGDIGSGETESEVTPGTDSETESQTPGTDSETESQTPGTDSETESQTPGTDSETESESTSGTQTGTYPAWASGVAYQLGDLVSYQGKVYECTYAHTSHGGWLPDGTPTLWKERADLVHVDGNKPSGGETDTETENGGETGDKPENNYYVNEKLPQHMVTGYWHNFCNGSTNLKLSDVPAYYDMICVAFTGNTATPGEVTFELDGDLCRALGGYTKAEFIQDIKDLKEKGQHVIISVGGAEGRIEINSDKAAALFAEGLIRIIEEYGFEGVDIDLEGSAVSGVNYIASALRTVHDHFGEDFIITMAPETYYIQADRLSSNDITTSYLRLALEIKDILTICYPQFYNTGGMNGYGGSIVNPGNADFLTSLSTLIIEAGLRPDQVALGVPSTSQAAGSGYVSPSVVKTAVDALAYGTSSGSFKAPKAYPAIRGVMTWSINWDATNNYAWAKAMDAAMDTLPEVEVGGSQKPGETEQPDETEKPSETEKPNETEEPSETEQPSETEKPSETEQPSETEKPDETEQPATDAPAWSASKVYTGGERVSYNGKVYEASWWTQGTNPENQGQWGPWKLIGTASGDNTGGGNEGGSGDNTGDGNEGGSGDNTGSGNESGSGDNQGSTEGIAAWSASAVYVGGDKVVYNGKVYTASWWTQGTNPEDQGQWGPWKLENN